MLKKSIKYTDYNGVERVEDFYFNLSKAEVAEMEISVDGGMSAMLEKIVESNNNKEILAMFKQIILKAYGEKSEDGKRFVKNEKISEGFAQTEAFSELFVELALNEDKAAEFVKGILPGELR